MRQSVTIDRTLRAGARARIPVIVKRILKKHGDLPDGEEDAVKPVLSGNGFRDGRQKGWLV